ncbi:hypothetical protein [Nocardia sp. NPDC019395]|uniref:hypothetical protein n=1 Tax=Nocardia sp. NPDC019395 TaxID=3154686 RepID=UPI0033F5C022
MAEPHGSPLTRRLRQLHGGSSLVEHSPPDTARIKSPTGAPPSRTQHDSPAGPTGGTRDAVLGEWRAVWRRDQQRIRIIRVRHISGDRTLLAVTDPDTAPDLADMRERFPELSGLWDVIRHQFWAQASQDAIR